MSLLDTYKQNVMLITVLMMLLSLLSCNESTQQPKEATLVEKKSVLKKDTTPVPDPPKAETNIKKKEPVTSTTHEITEDTLIQPEDTLIDVDSILEQEQVLLVDSVDTLSWSDSLVEAEIPESIEPVEIIKEELVASYQVLFFTDSISNTAVDSILSKASDIEIRSERFVTVEFWEHPLYASQFTMNGKVLRLYGVNPDSTISFVQHEQHQYLNYQDNYYLIENSFSLRPLSAEVDSFIIHQLQIH